MYLVEIKLKFISKILILQGQVKKSTSQDYSLISFVFAVNSESIKKSRTILKPNFVKNAANYTPHKS